MTSVSLEGKTRAALLRVLDRAIAIDGARAGNIQLFNPSLGGLEIVAQRGFDSAFLQLFCLVRPDDPSACARAFRNRERVVIADVNEDPHFVPYLSMMSHARVRGVQSTPVLDDRAVPIGVLSTHFPTPCRLSAQGALALDDCANALRPLLQLLAAELTPSRR